MKQRFGKLLCLLLCAATVISLVPRLTASAGYAEGYDGGMAGDGNGIYAHGVDLSNWQGHEVDFDRIREQGYSFVILRAGFATTEDDTFEENYTRAKAAGLDVGVYLYSYADTMEEVLRESAALKTWLSGKVLEYPVYYDMEDPNTHALMNAEALTALALAFLDDMAADGWLVGLYSCKSWLDGKLETQKICARYECWMAQYLAGGTYELYKRYDGMYGMWQYSSSGSVEGVSGHTDLNVCFKDYPAICRQYGFNGYSASGESLLLNGLTVPPVLARGERFPIEGKVISTEGVLTNVTVGIYDETGVMVTGRSAEPREASCSLSLLAEGVKLNELAVGSYEFRVIATNTVGAKVLRKQSLVISDVGVRFDEVSVPKDLKEGDAFKPDGKLLASTLLVQVKVFVLDADGKEACGLVAEPNAAEFDLASLTEPLHTDALATGSYIYRVEAVTQKGRQTLLSADFSVWVRNDPITLTGFSIDAEYRLRELTGLTGVVSSQRSPLREVRVTVLDRRDSVVAVARTERPKKQISLAEFRKQLALTDLPFGVYTCRIEALNDGGPCFLAERSFFVRSDNMSLCELSAPSCLREGDTFLLDGMVTSDASRLSYVGVSVTDAQRRIVLDAGTAPREGFCDLSELGQGLLFSTLSAGEYTIRIAAENGEGYRTLYEERLTVTQSDDRILWEDEHFSLDGTAFYACDGVELWGTILSQSSLMTKVTAEIFDEEGSCVTAVYKDIEARSFPVRVLNELLHISALPSGAYRLQIRAENASGETIVCSEAFSVTDCPHHNVCSGEVYAASCVRRGAICDSHCSDCGAKVRSGRILPREEHTLQDGVCTVCGKTDYYLVNVRVTEEEPRGTERYVLAYWEGDALYALGAHGETVRLSENGDGSATVSAALLWTPIRNGGSVFSFVGTTGRLHLDSDAVCVGPGSTNTLCFIQYSGAGYTVCLQENRTRWLSFSDGKFSTGAIPCELQLLVLVR